MFGAVRVLGFSHNQIRGAVCAGLVGGACIFITPLDVVVFASKVFQAVVVGIISYGGACVSIIIPAIEANLIDERGCLGGRFDILALRRSVII
jgi:hypothetical protein